jgi:hypothetical protein
MGFSSLVSRDELLQASTPVKKTRERAKAKKD